MDFRNRRSAEALRAMGDKEVDCVLNLIHIRSRRTALTLLTAITVSSGCSSSSLNPARFFYSGTPQIAPLGAISDGIWANQETDAEASKFVVYEHEFKLRSVRLNDAGEDHVKQIAAQLQEGASFPVVIERSMNDKSRGEYQYPVGPNPELDNQRRQVVIAALRLMGIDDAEQRVVVAPAFAQAATAQEAETGYLRGLQPGRSSGNFGGGFGGFGAGGGSGAGS